MSHLNSFRELLYLKFSGSLFHSIVVLGKTDDLNSSVLQRGTVLSIGYRFWYGFNSDTRRGNKL